MPDLSKEVIMNHSITDYTKESVKLVRNSKGFTWEIKIIGTGKDMFFIDDDLKRLKKLNTEIENDYGRTEE